MLSYLIVAVKRGSLVGPTAAQSNSYVCLKLQTVKSTTVPVRGKNPCWEQDFLL